MLFKTKFDLVVSLGEDCACSSYLRRCKLQNFSYPFDWLMSAPCKSRLDLILNNFADFFNKEDLSPLEKPKTGIVDEKCDYYADKRYGFHFLHDFRIGEPFDSEYLRVKARFERRIKRMYEQIAAAKNILFVWWSRDKRQELDFLRDYYAKLVQKFPLKSIYWLLIEYSADQENLCLAKDHILISRFDNISYLHNKEWNVTMGNETNNLAIFSQIKMKRSLSWRIRFLYYCLLKIMLGVIPRQSMRRRLREQLNARFYKEAL